MSLKKCHGQSMIEYILMVTAVVVVVIAFTAKGKLLEAKTNAILEAPEKLIQSGNQTVTFTTIQN